MRDVEPGEIVVLEPGRPPRSVRYAEANPALCVFELIYFARPDSYMEGRNLYEVRRRMGEQLAIEHPIDADLVMPVPDTGAPAAAGYAEESGLPYREGMYRNRYAGRTFIQPSQGLRHRGVTIKLNPLREVVAGKRLIVVDDSIVRGTTTKRIVELLRKAGAREVHVRISAPPIYHPCFYGIDTSIETELIAATHTEEQIREFIGADSLGYLSIRGVLAALELPVRPVLLRLLRRPLPGARPVRRRVAQVHARRDGVQRRSVVSVTDRRDAYRQAGVDVEAGERAVDLMRAHVDSTRRPEVVGGLGGFGGGFTIPTGYREPLLVASTDGVGTKTDIAAMVGRFDTIGIDLVAMCADDVVCAGAEPLAFLDYVAVGRLDPVAVAELVEGVAAGCRAAGAALVGGETAEHPGLMAAGTFDLAGCCIGVVERSRAIDGSAVVAGDVIVGLASSGLHANGYSLVRSLVAQWDLDLAEPYQARLRRTLGDAATDDLLLGAPHEAMTTLGEVLLVPTTIYARAVLAIRDAADIHGLAHITGGGLPGNVPRALPPTLAARLDPGRWRMPSVMRLFGALGGLDDEELRATFNGGLGMVAVDPAGGRPCGDPGRRRARDRGHGRRRGRAARSDGRRAVRGRPARDRRVSEPARIVVAVSGAGSNLRALHAAAGRGELGGSIVLVVADRACPALDWAVEQGIDTAMVPGGDDATLAEVLEGARPDVVVLAGYLRLIGPAVLATHGGRIVNVHPSLLPAFPGAHAIRDALDHGVIVTGVTVHLVDETLDGGPILAQEAVPVLPGDDEATLRARIRRGGASAPAAGRGAAGRRRDPTAGRRRPPRIDRPRAGGRARPAAAPSAAVGVGQDRPGRPRAWPRRPRLRARLDRRHGADAARGRPAGDGRGRGHRLARDARRSRQDAPSPCARRPAGGSTAR